jgi:Flp pilus assembly protein TadG
MVEFALVLPIFLLILTSILDFGFALFQRMTIINAARDGARAAVMVTDYATVGTVALAAATASASHAGVTLTGVDVKCYQTDPKHTYGPGTTHPCNFTAGDTDEAQSGDSVVVTAKYTWYSFFPLPIFDHLDMTATVQMVIE